MKSLISIILIFSNFAWARGPMCSDVFEPVATTLELKVFEDYALQSGKTVAELQSEMKQFEENFIWGTSRDAAIDFLRLISKRDYQKALAKGLYGTDVYGLNVFKAWKNTDAFLMNIPRGQLNLTVELFQDVHRMSTTNIFPTLQKYASWIPKGFLPTVGGVLKNRPSIGKDPLFHPLDEVTYQAIKSDPWLTGFIELPHPFSKPGKRRGVIYYAKPDVTRQKLNELVEWYNKNKDIMDPIDLAADFQRAFVSIHPFIDGNGRTSRLIMDRILWEKGLPPPILGDQNVDLYSNPVVYRKLVRQGVERYLTYLGQGSTRKNAQKDGVDIIQQGLDSFYKFLTIKGDVLNIKSVYTLGKEVFSFEKRDGFFYNRFGIPHRYHEGTMYPISDRAMWTYQRDRTAIDTNPGEISPLKEIVWTDHLQLLSGIESGKIDPTQIKTVNYAAIKAANENGTYHFYEWQKSEFRTLIEIKDSEPLKILDRSPSPKTEFEEAATYVKTFPEYAEATKKPMSILAQYKYKDLEFYEYQKVAEKMWPDLVPVAVASRSLVHRAGRALLMEFFQERNKLSSDAQQKLYSIPEIQLFDKMYALSKLALKTFDEAVRKQGDTRELVLRSDSIAANVVGFRDQKSWSDLIHFIPYFNKLRDGLSELNKKMQDSDYRIDISKKMNAYFAASTPETRYHVINLLPKIFRDYIEAKTQYAVSRFPDLVHLIDTKWFDSPYRRKSVVDEIDRKILDYALHASGNSPGKSGISFSTSLGLYLQSGSPESFSFSPDTQTGRLFLVNVDKAHMTWNFGTSGFTNEYELLGTKTVPAKDIIGSYKPTDFRSFVTSPGPEVTTFVDKYFGFTLPKQPDVPRPI